MLTLLLNSTEYFDFINFKGGEVGISLKKKYAGHVANVNQVRLSCRLTSSDTIMQLLLATEAIRSIKPTISISLNMPYIPYARQDRRMIEGDALSIKVFANIINSQNYSSVHVLDPHSDVATALIDWCVVQDSSNLVDHAFNEADKPINTIVIPDAGATKKTFKVLEQVKNTPHRTHSDPLKYTVVQAYKSRDLSNGKITKMSIQNPEDIGENCLIVDDICDGGRTFLILTDLLKENGAKNVSLCVSHGIFSNGIDCILEKMDTIYTTNSFLSLTPQDRIRVMDVIYV